MRTRFVVPTLNRRTSLLFVFFLQCAFLVMLAVFNYQWGTSRHLMSVSELHDAALAGKDVAARPALGVVGLASLFALQVGCMIGTTLFIFVRTRKK